jgi:hypothetical protein
MCLKLMSCEGWLVGILGGAGVGGERLSMCAAGLKSALESMGLYHIRVDWYAMFI